MKRATNMGEHIANEFLAEEMIRSASPDWLDFYRQVRRAVELKARAELSELPGDRRSAAEAWRELQDVLGFLSRAEDFKDDTPLLDFTKGGAK